MTAITNQDDVIDSRDVIDRIVELSDRREALQEEFDADPANEGVDFDNWVCNQTDWSREEQEELDALKALAEEAAGYAPDWRYGATLIREDYFYDSYAEQLCKDIGAIPSDMPDYIVIDWDATAKNLVVDYTEVDFDGETYLIR